MGRATRDRVGRGGRAGKKPSARAGGLVASGRAMGSPAGGGAGGRAATGGNYKPSASTIIRICMLEIFGFCPSTLVGLAVFTRLGWEYMMIVCDHTCGGICGYVPTHDDTRDMIINGYIYIDVQHI